MKMNATGNNNRQSNHKINCFENDDDDAMTQGGNANLVLNNKSGTFKGG
jgi:hypothetical protein